MSLITENARISDVLMFEEGEEVNFVRDAVTIVSGTAACLIGQVMAKIVTGGTATETHAGNTGTGAMTLDASPVLANAQAGIYTVKCTAASTDSGTFTIFDPKGNVLGTYVVAAAAFADQIKFTIADATDFIVGDKFLVTVGALVTKYVQVAPAGTDGSQEAAAVLLQASDASGGEKTNVVAVVRGPAVVKDSGLAWTSGMTTAQKTVAQNQLTSRGIKVASAYGA